MIRRIAALFGIGIVIAILVLLVWTVHVHRLRTMVPDDEAAVVSVES